MDAGRSRGGEEGRRAAGPYVVVALAIVALALGLRLWELDRRCLSHPENYVPGIAMPSWVRHPPPRIDIPSTVKSTLRDAHPPLYYYAMYPWVMAFGTGTVSLRLPSVLLGAASVFLLWRIALREVGKVAALLAALLLALHGHHVYWSQTARMYAPAAFLSLLSTLFLWRSFEDGRLRSRVLYALSTIAALWTHVYCWPVFLGQIVWASLRSLRLRAPPIALASQFFALVVSLPVIALAVFEYRATVSGDPMPEYFELGYLFSRAAFFQGETPEPPVSHAILLLVGIVTLVLGLVARPRPAIDPAAAPEAPDSRRFRLALLAIGIVTTLGLVAATFQAYRTGTKLFWVSLAIATLPVICAALFPAIHAWSCRLAKADRGLLVALAGRLRRLSPLVFVVSFVSMAAASIPKDTFVARGTLVFLPFLLLVVAAGVTPSGRFRWLGIPAAAALVLLHVASVRYFRQSDHSLRDYRGLAGELSKRLEPADRIFVTNQYTDPPLFYYLARDRWPQLVPDGWQGAVDSLRGRVWVILYEDQQMPPEMSGALKGMHEDAPLTAPGGRALLFTR